MGLMDILTDNIRYMVFPPGTTLVGIVWGRSHLNWETDRDLNPRHLIWQAGAQYHTTSCSLNCLISDNKIHWKMFASKIFISDVCTMFTLKTGQPSWLFWVSNSASTFLFASFSFFAGLPLFGVCNFWLFLISWFLSCFYLTTYTNLDSFCLFRVNNGVPTPQISKAADQQNKCGTVFSHASVNGCIMERAASSNSFFRALYKIILLFLLVPYNLWVVFSTIP